MPRKVTKTTTYYAYDELSEEAREHAREERAEDNHEHFDCDDMTNRLRDMAEWMGLKFDKKEVFWDLGHCQGDGVWFDGRPDLDHFLGEFEYPPDKDEPACDAQRRRNTARRKITQDIARLAAIDTGVTVRCRYEYRGSMSVEVEFDGGLDAEECGFAELLAWIEAARGKDGELDGLLAGIFEAFRRASQQEEGWGPDSDPIGTCGWGDFDRMPVVVALDKADELGLDTDRMRGLLLSEDAVLALEDGVRGAIEKYIFDAAGDLRRMGYEEIEYLCENRELLEDDLRDLGEVFDEDGNIIG